MYITIARVAKRFDMELYETTTEDLGVYHVRLTGYPRKGMGEVKVKVVGRR